MAEHSARLWVDVNPSMGRFHVDNPITGLSMSKARQVLGENLGALMNQSAEHGSAPAMERATAERGLKVGKSTVQRVLDGKTTVNLDYIEVFGKVFNKEPWQLLHPGLGNTDGASLSLQDALRTLVAFLSRVSKEQRGTAAELLNALARAPDSTTALDDLLETLSPKAAAPVAPAPSSAHKKEPANVKKNSAAKAKNPTTIER